MATADVSVQMHVRSSASRVWEAVADPRRIATWSPESTGVHTGVDGPLPVGATFTGSNRNGSRQWTTRCVVVESVRDRSFAFDVSYLGLAVARWRYSIGEVADGLMVVEEWWDRRGWLMTSLSTRGTGVADRRAHNEAGMEATLAALRAEMESPTTG